MKRIEFYLIIAALLFPLTCLFGQSENIRSVDPGEVQVTKVGDRLVVDMNLLVNDIDMTSQQMLKLVPVAKSNDGTRTYEFDPIIITGTKRDKALNRALDFGSYEFERTPLFISRESTVKNSVIPVHLETPYQDWMRDANLVFEENIVGCGCDLDRSNMYTVTPLLPPLYEPTFQLSYITPPAEAIKQRSETYAARLNFELNKYKILYNFKNNAEILDEVDRIVNEIRNDPNLNVTDFLVVGYASPEGNYQSNMTLSENRAKAFVSYLTDKYGISPSTIKTDWKGEDWEGLRRVVSGLYISDKDAVLNIIDNESDILQRKNKLRQLSGGETYRMLLREHYPPLRRTEYTISYIAKPFSVDEAKVQIRTKPQLLSQNEMYLVANTYPRDSKEFKEAFDVIARIYPDDSIAQLNSATLEIEKGDSGNDRALMGRLMQINLPEAWNNLGVMYANQGDYAKAEEYFNRAAVASVREAIANKDQLSKLRESQ